MTRPTLAQKLDPRRFSEMSPKMAAILAYILGDEADWETNPAIVELTVTSDGILLAGDTSDPLANAILGRADELAANFVAPGRRGRAHGCGARSTRRR